jgi:hypothetical protein
MNRFACYFTVKYVQVADLCLDMNGIHQMTDCFIMHGSGTLVIYRQLLFDSSLSLHMKFLKFVSEYTQTRLMLIHGYDNNVVLHVMAAVDQSGYFLD